MYAVIKFKDAEDIDKFDQIAAYMDWELASPLNSKIKGYVRVLYFSEGENFYEYLRDLGAFEEVALE